MRIHLILSNSTIQICGQKPSSYRDLSSCENWCIFGNISTGVPETFIWSQWPISFPETYTLAYLERKQRQNERLQNSGGRATEICGV